MLINLKRFGRLGNRLFLASHLIAFSARYGIPLLNLGFGKYAKDFPWFDGNASFAFPWRHTGSMLLNILARWYHLIRELMPWSHRFAYWEDKDLEFDKVEPVRLLEPLRAGSDVYFRGWLLRGYGALREHRALVLQVFAPRSEVSAAIDAWITGLQSPDVVLVGVHIRWEDFRNTPFFISAAEFHAAMKTMEGLLGAKRVKFLCFSNEPLGLEEWPDLDCHLSPGTSPMFDLYAMARCDYLMAPPSTFSGWASFWGEIPLVTLKRGQLDFRLADFQVVTG